MNPDFWLGFGLGALVCFMVFFRLVRVGGPSKPPCTAIHPELLNNNRCTLPDGHEGPHCVELFPHHLQRLQYWWKG